MDTSALKLIFNKPGRVPIFMNIQSRGRNIRINQKSNFSNEFVSLEQLNRSNQKKDGSYRLCIDFRPLKELISKSNDSMKKINKILNIFPESSIFLTLVILANIVK